MLQQSAKPGWSVQQDNVSPLHVTLSLVQIQEEEHVQAVKEQVRDLRSGHFQYCFQRALLPLLSVALFPEANGRTA